MAGPEPTMEFDGRFSEPGATGTPWVDVKEVLRTAEMFWLSTVRTDGRPHVTPLPAIWDDGALHICTGADEQKAVNLANDPRCILTTGLPKVHEGLDVVYEGTAERVLDHARLVRLADLWKAELDWDYEVVEGGFAHEAGEAQVFGINPNKVLSFAKGPYAQTRYRFT
jgi:hypothetical protein